MKQQAIRGLILFGLLVAVVSTARAQTINDKVIVQNKKDGSTKTYEGRYKVGPTGFQIVAGDKGEKIIATVNPDDVVKINIGDLPGVDRQAILAILGKEEKKDYSGARLGCQALLKTAGLQEPSKRYLEYQQILMANKIVDELDRKDKTWPEQADKCITQWSDFVLGYKTGWELWPATRACTRLQIERGKYEDAARAWGRLNKNTNLPPDARLEAALQEIDLQIRSKVYSTAVTTSAELYKTADGVKKERLAIYKLAAEAGSSGKPLDGIAKIKAEMDKTKDPSVHATGFSMMGELYLAGDKPRDAMWAFLWVETVVNQDKDDAFKAISRLAGLFETQLMDEEQANKYREKLKQFSTTF